MLVVRTLHKQYKMVKAVNGLSFEVKPGEVFALLGPNGAGKSTLVKMLVGFTFADSGAIELTNGTDVYPHIPSHLLGYLPEDRGLYPEKTVSQNLRYFAQLQGVNEADYKERSHYWLKTFSLLDRADEPLKSLSKGNQQKVQLITAVLHKPKWVILDEPFSGLDPINQELVVSFLADLKTQGMTVILSAHQMAMVEKLADKVLLLNRGESVLYDDMESVLYGTQHSILEVTFKEDINTTQFEALGLEYQVELVGARRCRIIMTDEQTLNSLFPYLAALGELMELRNEATSLHSIYLNAVNNHNKGQHGGIA